MSPHACDRFAAALPPEGAQSALGRPGGCLMSPHACDRFAAALPPEGAQSALGRPGGCLMNHQNARRPSLA
jgi:hypothetical protein